MEPARLGAVTSYHRAFCTYMQSRFSKSAPTTPTFQRAEQDRSGHVGPRDRPEKCQHASMPSPPSHVGRMLVLKSGPTDCWTCSADEYEWPVLRAVLAVAPFSHEPLPIVFLAPGFGVTFGLAMPFPSHTGMAIKQIRARSTSIGSLSNCARVPR